jgi:hypothetical protein
MLKIKDNVDLKELEKFGFKYFVNGCGTTGYALPNSSYWGTIIEHEREFNDKSKERVIHKDMPTDILFNLITADLVDKVSDNND